MKLLAICESPPTLDARHGDGSTLISAQLLARLPSSFEIDLVYFRDRPVGPAPRILERCGNVAQLDLAPSAAGLFSQLPRGTRVRYTREARRTVQRMAGEADVVYLHSLHTFAFARELSVPVVVHEVDAWSVYFAERAQRAHGVRAVYDGMQARRAAALERATAALAARYLVVGVQDAQILGSRLGRQIDVLANGIERCHPRPVHGDGEDGLIAFVGSLDYAPNVEAATVLARHVFPVVKREVPGARLLIAGRKAPQDVVGLANESIEVSSDVPDTSDVYARASVLAYPGSFGRGRKNTVLEAMGAGRPVVASSSAARGINTGSHIDIADSAEQMAARLVHLLRTPDARRVMSAAAAEFVASLDTWDEVALRFAEILEAAH